MDREWPTAMAPLQDRVVDWACAFVRDHVASHEQENLLLHAINIEPAEEGGAPRALIHLPLLVHGCITGEMEPAIPIAAAGYFLDRSIAILDSFMDGDPMPEWAERGPGQALLAATTLLGGFPMAALTRVAAPPEHILRLQALLVAGGLRVSWGQQADLRLRGAPAPTLDAALAATIGKTGEMMATLAEIAAMVATPDASTWAAYANIGRDYGTAWQIDSDLRDALSPDPSRDLANGTRSLPIAAYLAEAPGALDGQAPDRLPVPSARAEPASPRERAALLSSAYCISQIHVYCSRAIEDLERLAPRSLAGAMLADLVASVTIRQ